MSFRPYFEFYDEPPRNFGEHVRRTSDREVCAFVLLGVLAALASVCLLSGCATLGSPAVKTAAEIAKDLCAAEAAAHPDDPIDDAAMQACIDVINLVLAKPTPAAAKEALAAHPPLSIAAPCIDLKNPYAPQGE